MDTDTRESIEALLRIETTCRRPFSPGAWLAGMLRRIRKTGTRRRDVATLLDKSERELADIGLTRDDVHYAVRYGHPLTRRGVRD